MSYFQASIHLRTFALYNSASNTYAGYTACTNATASAARNSLLASSCKTVLVYVMVVIAVFVPTNVGFDPDELI